MSSASVVLTVRTNAATVDAVDDLAARLSNHRGAAAPGGRVTRTAAARLALQRGLDVLRGELEPRGGLTACDLPDPALLKEANASLEQLAELELSDLDIDVIRAFGELDVEVLRALQRLDSAALDVLCSLDASHIDALERLIELSDRFEDLIDGLE